jgi:hypothetical protein
LNKLCKINAHVSKADFIREAVREKLRKMGLLEKGVVEKPWLKARSLEFSLMISWIA